MNDMRYLASVVTQCFTSFGELLALNKHFAELTGGVTRCSALLHPNAMAASSAYCLLVPSGGKEIVSL